MQDQPLKMVKAQMHSLRQWRLLKGGEKKKQKNKYTNYLQQKKSSFLSW